MNENTAKVVTAAVLVIGDEILSGRTKDKNLGYLAEQLTELGIRLREARFVPDIEAEIVAAVNHCREKFDYVFTTGGIGPTHDDITADSVGAAFELEVTHHPEAVALLTAHYKETGAEFNEARMRMARTPLGATLVSNPISKAPGFRVENVYVMAGIPVVAEAMFQSLKHELVGGDPVLSAGIRAYLPEGTLAKGLGDIQGCYNDVDIGSYPFHRDGRYGAAIVCRSTDAARLEACQDEVRVMIDALGGEAIEIPADEE
jgi:molybdenum cofactor synthesis domain-containing protein